MDVRISLLTLICKPPSIVSAQLNAYDYESYDEVLHKKAPVERIYKCLSSWSQQGMILRPPDYESGATNQLSYGTENSKNLKFTEPPFWVTALQRYEIFFEFQLANLDLDLNTTWEFKLHEGINGLLGRLVDVEKAAV